MTVLFSDICGSTAYVDRVGDIAGRAWMQQHHDIALPIIKKHDGKILDIEGDGFLASFSQPPSLPLRPPWPSRKPSKSITNQQTHIG